jgi:hypothetical protein
MESSLARIVNCRKIPNHDEYRVLGNNRRNYSPRMGNHTRYRGWQNDLICSVKDLIHRRENYYPDNPHCTAQIPARRSIMIYDNLALPRLVIAEEKLPKAIDFVQKPNHRKNSLISEQKTEIDRRLEAETR